MTPEAARIRAVADVAAAATKRGAVEFEFELLACQHDLCAAELPDDGAHPFTCDLKQGHTGVHCDTWEGKESGDE